MAILVLVLLLLWRPCLSTSLPIFHSSLLSNDQRGFTSPDWLRINPDMTVWLQRSSESISPINSELERRSISNPIFDPNPMRSKTNECDSVDGRLGICYDANVCSTKQGTPLGRCGNSVNKVCCVCKHFEIHSFRKFKFIKCIHLKLEISWSHLRSIGRWKVCLLSKSSLPTANRFGTNL